MYEDFHVVDRWSKQPVHVLYQAQIIAIATRHADAVDYKFLVEGKPAWVALPHPAWAEYNRQTGKVITDPLAVQIAGRFLRTAIESGYYDGRELCALTVEQTLDHARAVLNELGAPQTVLPKAASPKEPLPALQR
jgi:hypothetical protein